MAHKCCRDRAIGYIPWKGYFDLIRAADEFILLDDVQFTKRDWRSRNRIKTKDGLHWLSIPVHTKVATSSASGHDDLRSVVVRAPLADRFTGAYARTPFFDVYAPPVRALYESPVSDRLSDVNRSLIEAMCGALGITTPIRWSSEYHPSDGRNERLIDLCVKAGASHYLSGPSARGYIDEAAFTNAGISVHFVDYSGYPEYPQPFPPFEHAVSALDVIFCAGPRAIEYMKDLSPASITP
jgi:hypothetical protein